jgi:hypothetical protein
MYADRDELFCHCDETVGGNRVWGTDVYTDDSALCHAALHAGAIPQSGGVIHVRGRRPQQLQRFDAQRRLDRRLWRVGRIDRVRQSRYPGQDARRRAAVSRELQRLAGFSGNCRCDADSSGPVWGTNPYTDDSAVCSAAIHAGVIGAGGGVVHLSPAPGQSRYGGSTRNGFTTSDYGSWPRSFRSAPRSRSPRGHPIEGRARRQPGFGLAR